MVTVKKVVLFGRTGDGKSTVGNVLLTRDIKEVVFQSSDSASGCTRNIETKSRGEWTVTDTVGIGEAMGNVSEVDAREKLEEFLRNVSGSYSHIIYVQNANRRITELDGLIWEMFTSIFSGAEKVFVVLFTHASDGWLDRNRASLPEEMKKHPIIATDIPPVGNKALRKFHEMNQDSKRRKSIARLEADLEKIFKVNKSQSATPLIVTMSQRKRREAAESIWQMIITRIKAMFPEPDWMKIARVISTIVDVREYFGGRDRVK